MPNVTARDAAPPPPDLPPDLPPYLPRDVSPGLAEIRAARDETRRALTLAVVFSVFVNLLMLTSPLYMLQVYDRVLVSRSEETLLALSLLAAVLFGIMGLLDLARARIMARIGARLQAALDGRVLSAAFRRLAIAPDDTAAIAAQRDLDALARFWAAPVLLALFDAPWTPVFIAALFVFHPWLGWLAVAGAVVVILAGWCNQVGTDAPLARTNLAVLAADRQAENLKSEAELVQALGMSGAAFLRWNMLRSRARSLGLAASDIAGRWSVFTRTFRLGLQSAMLGLAAWLALHEQVSGGAMIAASVLMGRALQPVEQAVAQWSVLTRARQARVRLGALLQRTPPAAARLKLPRPEARLEVQSLTLCPPGNAVPVLRGISLSLGPGQAMGVIGASGSGKSSLARALTGIWSPAAGTIRLGGATLNQFDPDVLGGHIGYLPQRVTLFDGTVAENIARLQTGADPDRIIAAARAAAAHDLILHLPQGYETQVSTMGSRLSGGQIQRIGLARALFGDPVLLVLDEPNSNLDNDGSTALNLAIRAAKAAGSIVLIMAHRPAAIQECDLLLVMKDGGIGAIGPRDAILRDMVRNAGDIARSFTQGSVA